MRGVGGTPAYLVMQVKNLGHYFSFEVEVLDDKGEHRRFRANNFQVRTAGPGGAPARHPHDSAARSLATLRRAALWQNTTRVKDYICTMPMKLESGWNQVQLNLADLTKCAFPRPRSASDGLADAADAGQRAG